MSYRNDLAASQAQIAALRVELSRKEREIASLRGKPKAPNVKVASPAPVRAGKVKVRAKRGVRFVAPHSYFPLFHMLRDSIRHPIRHFLSMSLPPTKSDAVVVWIGRHALRPFMFVAKVLCILAVAATTPIIAINTALYSLLLLPILLSMSIRIGDRKGSEGLLSGRPIADDDGLYFFLMMMPPLMFPGLFAVIGLLSTLS
jgi:hypothetical protein